MNITIFSAGKKSVSVSGDQVVQPVSDWARNEPENQKKIPPTTQNFCNF
jgi:hypothetical protein